MGESQGLGSDNAIEWVDDPAEQAEVWRERKYEMRPNRRFADRDCEHKLASPA